MSRMFVASCMLVACAAPSRAPAARTVAPLTVLSEPLADPIAFVPSEHADAYAPPTTERRAQLDAELAVIQQRGEPLTPELVQFARESHGLVVAAAPLGVAGPRTVARGHGYEITLTPDPLLHDLHVQARHADGRVEEMALHTGPDGTVHTSGGCGMTDEEVWLSADAQPIGQLAQWPVYCGLTPPTTYWIEPQRNLATLDPAARLVSIINRERRRAFLPALPSDPRAVRAALGFAATMREAHTIEHVVEGTTPVARLAAEGLVPVRTAETTLHTQDLQHAAEQLMNEPRYRDQLVGRDLNRVGAAVIGDGTGGLYVDVLYLHVVPPVDTERMTRELATALRKAPYAASWMRVDADLSELARTFATLRARGWTDESIRRAYKTDVTYRLGGLGLTWTTRAVTDVDHIALDDLTAKAPFDLLALGVAQASDRGALAGTVFIVTFTGCLGGDQRSFGDAWPDCRALAQAR